VKNLSARLEFIKKVLNIIRRNGMGIIYRVMTKDPVVSLTFDDGPDPVYTPKVLDILKEYGALATFFMVGVRAHNYPGIVERVDRDGHAIGNHSWNHFAFSMIPSVARWKQIRKCQRAIKPCGQRLFRPPSGLNSRMSRIELMLQGYKIIGWSLSSEDWCERDSKVMADNLVKNIKPGSIILFHDYLFDRGVPIVGPKNSQCAIIDREPMLLALRELLERLKGNIRFVTIPVLLRCGQP
jgi:peptidoglycan/xylan/chitin deacetylase (PgdA/CDA1 family)